MLEVSRENPGVCLHRFNPIFMYTQCGSSNGLVSASVEVGNFHPDSRKASRWFCV